MLRCRNGVEVCNRSKNLRKLKIALALAALLVLSTTIQLAVFLYDSNYGSLLRLIAISNLVLSGTLLLTKSRLLVQNIDVGTRPSPLHAVLLDIVILVALGFSGLMLII